MTWYRRHECGLRMAIFFSAATAAGAFGGLLARGISEMTGVGGLMGWSWIFILEGIVTFIVAIWAYFQIHDFPDTAKFLTEEERLEVHRRLREDRSGLAEEWHMKYVIQALTDWRYLDSYANHSWHVYRPVQRQPVPADDHQEHGVQEQQSATHDCPTIRRRVCLHY